MDQRKPPALLLLKGVIIYAGKKAGCPKEEFGLGIPMHQTALNVTPKGIIAKTTVTPKDIETQHLKLPDAVYRDFFITMLG